MLQVRIQTITRTSRRYVRYSSSAVSYPKQVRAYPFAFGEAEAARRASLAATLARPADVLTCLKSYFLHAEPVKPTRVAAVYLPGWIIDADVEMRMKPQEGEGDVKPRKVVARFKNSYMPGFAHDPLSHMSFKDLEDNKTLPLGAVPWSSTLEKQHDKDVICLPFTMTPFSLVNAARTEQDLRGFPEFKYDHKSLKQTFLAAYPVLMPVYLLQYESQWDEEVNEGDPNHVFVIVDASTTSTGRVATENRIGNFAALMLTQLERLIWLPKSFPLIQFDRGELTPRVISHWVKLDRLFVLPADSDRKKALEVALDFLAQPVDAWDKYKLYDAKLRKEGTGSEDIDWNDLRIREYSKEETEAIEMYMMARAEHFVLRDMVSTLSNMTDDGGHPKSTVDSRELSPPTETSNQFTEQFKHVLALLNWTKPDWVKAWEAQHKEEAEDDGEISKEERQAKAELVQEAQGKSEKEQAERAAQETAHKKVPEKNDPPRSIKPRLPST